mmetsp:Transcript_26330/g.48287  ORF Transcript_26330/g.48287 Transcript_26330/m.48287 type:complete len:208 (-) Transcript_26330:302-925(-)
MVHASAVCNLATRIVFATICIPVSCKPGRWVVCILPYNWEWSYSLLLRRRRLFALWILRRLLYPLAITVGLTRIIKIHLTRTTRVVFGVAWSRQCRRQLLSCRNAIYFDIVNGAYVLGAVLRPELNEQVPYSRTILYGRHGRQVEALRALPILRDEAAQYLPRRTRERRRVTAADQQVVMTHALPPFSSFTPLASNAAGKVRIPPRM